MGGALKRSSGLNMYTSCPYGPGGELDRSTHNTSPHQHWLFLLDLLTDIHDSDCAYKRV